MPAPSALTLVARQWRLLVACRCRLLTACQCRWSPIAPSRIGARSDRSKNDCEKCNHRGGSVAGIVLRGAICRDRDSTRHWGRQPATLHRDRPIEAGRRLVVGTRGGVVQHTIHGPGRLPCGRSPRRAHERCHRCAIPAPVDRRRSAHATILHGRVDHNRPPHLPLFRHGCGGRNDTPGSTRHGRTSRAILLIDSRVRSIFRVPSHRSRPRSRPQRGLSRRQPCRSVFLKSVCSVCSVAPHNPCVPCVPWLPKYVCSVCSVLFRGSPNPCVPWLPKTVCSVLFRGSPKSVCSVLFRGSPNPCVPCCSEAPRIRVFRVVPWLPKSVCSVLFRGSPNPRAPCCSVAPGLQCIPWLSACSAADSKRRSGTSHMRATMA
jgi:hypothetical protein